MDYGADQITDPERTKSKIISNETENIGTREIEIEIWKKKIEICDELSMMMKIEDDSLDHNACKI